MIDNFEALLKTIHSSDEKQWITVDKRLAKQLLSENKNIIIKGNVRYFTIKNKTLGVYAVRLNDLGETVVE